MPWAFFLQELFELLLHRCLPASRNTIHSRDEVVSLALSGWTRIVLLALVGTIVICAPQVAVIASQEPLLHLFLLLGPVVHHVMKSCNSFWSVPLKVSVDIRVGDAIVEAVDNVLLRDIHNGGTHVEETACVGSEELVAVAEPPELFRLKCASHRSLADTNSTHFKRNNSLVCRVSARYNHGSTGSKQVHLARRRVYNHNTAHQLLIYIQADINTNLVQT
jgi:hypothetical protein